LRQADAFLRLLALVLAGVGITGVALWLLGDGPPRPSEPRVVTSSVRLGGGLECTASVPAEVQPGGPVGLRFSHENHGSEPVEVSFHEASGFRGGGTSFLVRGIDGREFDLADEYRSLFVSGGPYREPIRLSPGESYTSPPIGPRVRWGGPLTIEPRRSGKRLEPLTVQVAVVGNTPGVADALRRAAQDAAIFEHCMPQPDGGPVVGRIAPPDGALFDPLRARCWAEVRTYDGFAAVTFAVLSPPSAPAVPLTEYLADLRVPDEEPSEAFQWAFVVTESEVLSVDGPAYRASMPPMLVEVQYEWEEGSWRHFDPGETCGGGLSYGGGLVFFTEAYEPCG
jgi:hypothetical protein